MPVGRPRSFAAREPNGRPQRPSVERLKEIERGTRMAETATVLAQPHRRGDGDPWRVSALGRFCQRMKLRRELYDAAVRYLNVRRWWGAAVGRPRGFENMTSKRGNGPSEETVRGWLREYMAIDLLLSTSPEKTLRFSQFYSLVVDDIDPQPRYDRMLAEALMSVAVHMGYLSGRDSAFNESVAA